MVLGVECGGPNVCRFRRRRRRRLRRHHRGVENSASPHARSSRRNATQTPFQPFACPCRTNVSGRRGAAWCERVMIACASAVSYPAIGAAIATANRFCGSVLNRLRAKMDMDYTRARTRVRKQPLCDAGPRPAKACATLWCIQCRKRVVCCARLTMMMAAAPAAR